MNNLIGITEGADPTINYKWIDWVRNSKPAILITKMPQHLIHWITPHDNIIVHCSITGLGGTGIEPNIVDVSASLKAYHEICDFIGKHRVVLRIDPIVNWEKDKDIIKSIANEAEDRVRISFVDLYPHVINRFYSHKVELPRYESFHMPLDVRKDAWKELGYPEVCCEPNMPSVPCVSKLDCGILGVEPNLKRKGQRPLCGCLANKIELCKAPPKCTYGCLYCYWK